MRCTLMTKEDISPHMIQNKISEKRYYISLKEYEKILLLTDWASSHYHHLFVFVLFFSKLQQLPVYNIVFHSWAQNVFLFVLSPLFPLNTLKPQSFFFSPSSARKLTKCQLSFLTMHTHTHTHPFKTWLKIVGLFIFISFPLSWVYGWCPIFRLEWKIPSHPEKSCKASGSYRGRLERLLKERLSACLCTTLFWGDPHHRSVEKRKTDLEFQELHLKWHLNLEKSVSSTNAASRMTFVNGKSLLYIKSYFLFSGYSSFFPACEKTFGEELQWWNGKIWVKCE